MLSPPNPYSMLAEPEPPHSSGVKHPASRPQPLPKSTAPSASRVVATPVRSTNRGHGLLVADDPVECHAGNASPPSTHGGSAVLPLLPISHLSTFMPRCRIRARVIGKSAIRTFQNARGSGKLFSVELMDADGACTRATFFGKAVDKFFNVLVVKCICEISGASIKLADRRYSDHSLELTADEKGTTVAILPEDNSIPALPFKFVPIASLRSAAVKCSCDIAAIAAEVEELVTMTTRIGERQRRRITLIDDSSASVALTLWGDRTELPIKVGSVVFVRGARISDFNGRSLDAGESAFLDIDPDDSRAFQLQRWYQEVGKEQVVRLALSTGNDAVRGRRQFLSEAAMEDSSLQLATGGLSSVPNDPQLRYVYYHRISPVTVMSVPHDRPPFYYACTFELPSLGDGRPPRTCSKKVINGRCSSEHVCDAPAARFMLRLKVADPSWSVFVEVSGDKADAIAGISAEGLANIYNAKEAGDVQAADAYETIFRKMCRRCSMGLRSRKEAWEGKERVRMSVEQCSPIDCVAEGFSMVNEIRRALSLHGQ